MNQIKSGAILSYLGLLLTISIALVYTPIVIRLLNQSEYGLYALIGSFAAYFSVMDMGLGNAVVRYTARNRATKDKGQESKLNGLFLLLFSIIGIFVIIAGIVIFNRIENIFGNSLLTEELDKAKIMIIILTVNFSLSFPLAIFGSLMQAYERFIVVKLVSIARTLLVPLITLPFLFLGHGSVAMIAIIAVVNIGCLLFNAFYCLKKLNITFHFGKIDSALVKEILSYSFFVFLSVIVDQVYWNTDQFIIGAIAGTVPVAIYAIAMQFIVLYMSFSTSISGLFLPKVSIMVAKDEGNDRLSEMMIRFGRLQFIILSFILSGFILFGKSFINLWAGINYSTSYYIILIIMIPLSIPLIQNLGISILYAKNLQKFRSVNLIFIAIFNIIITIPLVQNLEGLGAALATAISLFIGNVLIMNFYYYFKIGINIPLFWKNIALMCIPVTVSMGIGSLLNKLWIYDNTIFLLVKIIIFSVIFILLMWIWGLNNSERKLFSSTGKSIKRVILKILKKFGDKEV